MKQHVITRNRQSVTKFVKVLPHKCTININFKNNAMNYWLYITKHSKNTDDIIKICWFTTVGKKIEYSSKNSNLRN